MWPPFPFIQMDQISERCGIVIIQLSYPLSPAARLQEVGSGQSIMGAILPAGSGELNYVPDHPNC
jgi:hypothetical protein